MGNRYVEHKFTGQTCLWSEYDPSKTVLGTLMGQFTGSNPTDKWAGPLPTLVGRPMEATTAISSAYPYIVKWSATKWWIFLADISTAAATRRIVLYELDWTTWTLSWKGFITLTYPTTTNHTIRGLCVAYEKYTTGQASCSGDTAVVGVGTAWQSSRLCVGSRIGFFSQDPSQITTWYEIGAINSDSSITLTGNGPNTGGNVDYVIEDLRVLNANTNATPTNGGLFMAKGLRYENFIPAGTTIPAAGSTDNVRAVYWLADAATVTNTTTGGLARKGMESWTTDYVYLTQGGGGTSVAIFKYNIRKDLVLTSGKDTTAFVLSTANQVLTGNLSQVNNLRCDTLGHGPGSGILSLYFVTASRVYRAAESNITSGNSNWVSDYMNEVPPGGTTTFGAMATLASVEVASTLDRLVIVTTASRGYVTQYRTDGGQLDHIFLITSNQFDQSSADAGTVPHPNVSATQLTMHIEDGLAAIIRGTTSATTNILYIMPLGAHWAYAGATNQRLATPKMSTPNCRKYNRVSVHAQLWLGSDNLGISPEAYRVYYRTAGIDDNSGTWTLVDQTGDLSASGGSDYIQFMVEFRTIFWHCVPARIFSIMVTYEDDLETDSHYEPSLAKTVIASRRFGYRQKTAWGTNIPNLRIRLYNAQTGVLQLDDDTNTQALGTFEYSTDGTVWHPWDSTKDQVGNFIRYTANALADGIMVRALLTLG